MRFTHPLAAATASLALFALIPLSAQADLFGRDGEEAAVEGGGAPEAQAETAPVTPAMTSEDLVEALPLSWRGTFAWDEGVAFYVEMDIVKLTVRPDGEVAFNAESRWYPDQLDARMSGRIDPATLSVRIWEIAENASADEFESDGAYVGAFAPDLWDLRARWETNGSGEGGDLVLITTAQPGAVQ